MNCFTIVNKDAGQRLDKYVSRILSRAPRSFVYKSLRNKDIRLNGNKADGTEILKAGDEVLFRFPDVQFDTLSAMHASSGYGSGTNSRTAEASAQDTKRKNGTEPADISRYCRIIFEDEDIIIADKKAGVLSQKSVPSDVSLNEVLLAYAGGGDELFTPSVCNRLDRNTSGLITFAKTYKGARELNGLFKERGLEKYYLAYVAGEVKEPGHVYGTFSKNEKNNTVKISLREPESERECTGAECGGDRIAVSCAGGIITETAFKPIKTGKFGGVSATLLSVRLYTGKTHQIRATLAALGHPVLGDAKYGTDESAKAARRLMLHSYRMVIPGIGTFTAENKEFM